MSAITAKERERLITWIEACLAEERPAHNDAGGVVYLGQVMGRKGAAATVAEIIGYEPTGAGVKS